MVRVDGSRATRGDKPMTATQRWAERVIRIALGCIFVYSGYLKSIDPRAFADSVYSFALLPRVAVNPFAGGLPILEMLLGAMLVLGLARRAATALTVLLYAVFLLVIGQALVRGLKIDCGCFGGGTPSTWSMPLAILRDTGLFAAAFYVFRHARSGSSRQPKSCERQG